MTSTEIGVLFALTMFVIFATKIIAHTLTLWSEAFDKDFKQTLGRADAVYPHPNDKKK